MKSDSIATTRIFTLCICGEENEESGKARLDCCNSKSDATTRDILTRENSRKEQSVTQKQPKNHVKLKQNQRTRKSRGGLVDITDWNGKIVENTEVSSNIRARDRRQRRQKWKKKKKERTRGKGLLCRVPFSE